MLICDYNKCTGCYGCVNICPMHCIEMNVDDYGETHPIVNDDKCIGCEVCIKACPNNVESIFRYPQGCLAAWSLDKTERCECASGGVATIISKYIIEVKHGVVFGTCYDEELCPIVSCTETLEGLGKFKGSKYVQSIVGDNTYNDMEEYLRNGRSVLFVGTPCQIAAANLRMNKYDNFYTVDLICHGVSPTMYFNQEVAYLMKKHSLKDIVNIRFRGNDSDNYRVTIWSSITKKYQNNFVMTFWKREGNDYVRTYRAKPYNDYYLLSFLKGISLRDNCYTCQYARPERVSDITVGDFIGLGNKTPFEYSADNVSSVFLNTDKGKALWREICVNISNIVVVERDYKERLEYGPGLRYPYERHKLNGVFREQFKESQNYPLSIRKAMRGVMFFRFIKYIASYWSLVYRVPRKICGLMNKK